MVRTRLASLALAAGLGLVSGCLFPERPILSRFRATPCCETGCCETGGCAAGVEGPVLEGMPPPPPPGSVFAVPSAPPRLVPTPQATPMPYVPDGR